MISQLAWIVATIAVAGTTSSSEGFKGKLDAIVKEQQEAQDQFTRAVAGKTAPEAWRPILDRYNLGKERRAVAALNLVRANLEDPAVLPALDFVIRTALGCPGEVEYGAIELIRDHQLEPGMADVCVTLSSLSESPDAGSILRAVLLENPSRTDRGAACYYLSHYLGSQARMARRLAGNAAGVDAFEGPRKRAFMALLAKTADPDALAKESEALLERVIREFGDVTQSVDLRPLGLLAEGELFQLRNLSVGKVAPEIKGKDHEGKPFALSDSRGKVILLTFSGDWNDSCKNIYPQERKLVARWKDRPFVMVSVSTDESVATLKKSIESGEITWRCWWDGGPEGPITTRWGIASFPTIFVIDASGVIRFKNIYHGELDHAIESLMTEVPGRSATKP